MKRFTEWLQKVVLRIRVPNDEVALLALVNYGQNAVVGSNKILILPAHQERPSFRSNPRVHNDDVNRFRREIRVGGSDGQRSIEQIKGRHVMRYVDKRHFRIDLEYDGLERSDEMIVGAVIGCQCDDGIGHEALPLGILAAVGTKWEGTSYLSTLSEARSLVKKSRVRCCAIANVHFRTILRILWALWNLRRLVSLRGGAEWDRGFGREQ